MAKILKIWNIGLAKNELNFSSKCIIMLFYHREKHLQDLIRQVFLLFL